MKKKAAALAAIVLSCAAGCAVGSRTIYDGNVNDTKVKYELAYTASLGPEPDYKMTVELHRNETWVLIDDNMDRRMKPGEDVVLITKDYDTKKYRGITPSTAPIMQEADRLYQKMLAEIEKKKREPISNKGLRY